MKNVHFSHDHYHQVCHAVGRAQQQESLQAGWRRSWARRWTSSPRSRCWATSPRTKSNHKLSWQYNHALNVQRSLKHQSPKIQVFSDSKHEKAVRGRLKSEVLEIICFPLLQCHDMSCPQYHDMLGDQTLEQRGSSCLWWTQLYQRVQVTTIRASYQIWEYGTTCKTQVKLFVMGVPRPFFIP